MPESRAPDCSQQLQRQSRGTSPLWHREVLMLPRFAGNKGLSLTFGASGHNEMLHYRAQQSAVSCSAPMPPMPTPIKKRHMMIQIKTSPSSL